MFTNVLVPLDGSDLAEQALPVAQDIARQFNATIHLVQAVSRHTEVELGGGGYLSPGALEMEMDMAKNWWRPDLPGAISTWRASQLS